MSPTWIAESYKDPTVKKFVAELRNLVSEYSHRIRCDEGKRSLIVKDRLSGKKLIEYWPDKNMICRTVNNHKGAGVPQALSDEYHAAVKQAGKPVNGPKIFIKLLRKIIESLDKDPRGTSKENK